MISKYGTRFALYDGMNNNGKHSICHAMCNHKVTAEIAIDILSGLPFPENSPYAGYITIIDGIKRVQATNSKDKAISVANELLQSTIIDTCHKRVKALYNNPKKYVYKEE